MSAVAPSNVMYNNASGVPVMVAPATPLPVTIAAAAGSSSIGFAAIDAASSGDNTLVAAVAGKKIRVLSYVLVAAGTVNVRFESGASGTALTGQMNLIANAGAASGYNPAGHFQTATNTLLNLELSGNVSVDGHLTYELVD